MQTYQHGKFIAQCLDSILGQQTNFEFEIVIGEDDSQDGTREICQQYAARHPDQIRLFLHDRKDVIYINGRPTGRFIMISNQQRARGRYIAMCDGDDYWNDPTKLQQQYDFLEAHPDFVMCFHRAQLVDENDQLIDPPEFIPNRLEHLSREEVVAGAFIPTLTVFYRNLRLEFPDVFKQVVNADTFLFSMLGQHGKAGYLPDINDARYRVHSGGLWSAHQQPYRIKSRIDTFEQLRPHLDSQFLPNFTKRVGQEYHRYLLELFRNGQYKDYFAALRQFGRFQRRNQRSATYEWARHGKALLRRVLLPKIGLGRSRSTSANQSTA